MLETFVLEEKTFMKASSTEPGRGLLERIVKSGTSDDLESITETELGREL